MKWALEKSGVSPLNPFTDDYYIGGGEQMYETSLKKQIAHANKSKLAWGIKRR